MYECMVSTIMTVANFLFLCKLCDFLLRPEILDATTLAHPCALFGQRNSANFGGHLENKLESLI